MNGVARRVPIVESSQVAEARRIAIAAAAGVGFNETEAGGVGLAITEIATNLVKHGESGELLIRDRTQDNQEGLEVLALDKGRGMKNVAECMRDGYSSSGSPGTGLGAISRLSTLFDIYSTIGKGTALFARFEAGKKQAGNPLLEIDGFSVAVQGEELSGDAWTFRATREGAVIFAIDGLGHGSHAEEAAQAAIAAFRETSAIEPLAILDNVHRGTRATRGAAAAIANVDTTSRTVRFTGVGNIAGVIISGAEARHVVSMNGILGHEMRTPREFSYPWTPDSVFILHSDGVSARWDLSAYPGLLQKPAGLIAGVLYRDHRRERDDATVIVIKQNKNN